MNRQESVGDSRSAASSRFLFLEPFAHSEPKKSNPVSQGDDDVLKMSNPPRWRHRVRFFGARFVSAPEGSKFRFGLANNHQIEKIPS